MPLFNDEQNRVANDIGSANLTIWLHTAAPTNGSPTNGRTTTGGGSYESGIAITAANISDASSGVIQNSVAIDFGTADEDVGVVTHWSAYRGTAAVAYGTLPSNPDIRNGDSFEIPANSLSFTVTSS